ncbi:MAG: stage II sporulation protein R [Ruminococcaceae bacterium]|nr:stage II sporulation protein R [Oscillospiraceae bacterium]
MKFCLTSAISILIAAILLSCLPVHEEERIYTETIRLHVRAASDSPEDQALKLKVRDSILCALQPVFENVQDKTEAEELLSKHLETIEQAAEKCIADNGYTYTAKAELCDEWYPTREYDDFTLPAGEYRSLQVKIGGGEGKNWWCILFPSVCGRFASVDTEEEYIAAGFTPEQYRMITKNKEKKYVIRFRILEILESVFRLNGEKVLE